MDEEDDYELSYSRNDHDEGEYVNPEFFNVHGHKRSKPNTKRKRKRKSNKCMNMTSGSCGTSDTDGSKDVNVTEERSARRGIVNMLKVKKARNKGIVQTVNWNQLGQPIGKESVTLVHFVGSYARRNVPIICDDWRKKEWKNVKQNLWDEVKVIRMILVLLTQSQSLFPDWKKMINMVSLTIVVVSCFAQTIYASIQETFNGVGDEHRKKIIRHAGNLHRGFHTRLRSMARDSNGNYSAKPPPMYAHFSSVERHWKVFVEQSMKEEFVEKSEKNKEKAKAMGARYKKACLGYARIREIIIQEKINAGVENPTVSRLDAWEYARRDADGKINDPATLQILQDLVSISENLPEHELTNIGTDDLLARALPLEWSDKGQVTTSETYHNVHLAEQESAFKGFGDNQGTTKTGE
ncbi:hypothetical protein POM88_015362 [Heracleum sosnowskyi]|uniref:Uncharacterized protein n=1 Tax=Heracleum sosnowskyi TaxID=360622 RepID=A0AAD8MW46_9APIA|nr:hypothetical protein POM88_015362 [Heracleum sosnowskyi]